VSEVEDCLRQVMAIRGALGASLIDHTSGQTVGSVGRGPSGDQWITAAGTSEVVRATVQSAAFASAGRPGYVDDIVITATNGYHMIHFLPTTLGIRLVLYIWLDRLIGNLAMTQRCVRSITSSFVPG